MKTLSLILTCSAALFAQSFPSALYTPAVAKDNVATTFSLAMAIGDTTAFVGSTTGWAANMYAYVCDSSTSTAYCTGTFEIMKVTSVGGSNALNVSRAQAGTSAVAHAAQKLLSNSPTAIYNLTLSQEVLAIETFLGISGANVAQVAGNNAFTGTNTHANTETFNGALNVAGAQTNTGTVNARSATHTSPAQTGVSASKPATCTAGDQYFATDATAGQNLFLCTATNTWTQTTTLPAASAALQQLRIKPNVGNITTSEYANPTWVNAADYNYPAQTPGGSLTGAVGASVTLTPCPLGVLGTNTRLRFYISGGTGTAESVASTGAGTCTSGGTTGTITFTPVNSHSGAWTVTSSHAGIYEAIAANPGREVHVPGGLYTMRDCMSLNPAQNLILSGDGNWSFSNGTVLSFATVTSGCNAISIIDTGYNSNEPKTFRNLGIIGTTTASGGHGFYFEKVVRVTLDAVTVFYFGGSCVVTQDAFEVSIVNGSQIAFCGKWGVAFLGVSNLNRIVRSYVGTNSRLDGYGNVEVIGTSAIAPTENITLEGMDSEGAGLLPFTSVTTAYGLYVQNVTGFALTNSYLESNTTDSILYQDSVSGITEYNNWFNTQPLVYGANTSNVKSWGNTFVAGAIRSVAGVDLSTWDIGRDTCIGAATECTAHPRYLGNVTAISTTGAPTAAKMWNYIATESGSNNAIAGALLDQSGAAVPLAAGLQVTVKLAHTLQIGANTFTFNATAKNIKSHLNIANNIAAAYAATGTVTLFYDGTQWQDMSQ